MATAIRAEGKTIPTNVVSEDEPAVPRLFLAVVAASVFVTTFTGSMVSVVIPLMRAEFGASAAQVGWVVTGYSLAYAVGVPLYGRISDGFGVRRVFVVGLLGFVIGALICALAPNFATLVLGRIVQGVGGAAVPALASVAVAKVMPPGQRGRGLGLTASSVGVGSAVGPIVGGVVAGFLGWRAPFLGSLLLMLAVIPFAMRVLPNGGDASERRFDILGGILLGLSSGLFLFGITQGQVAGFGSVWSWSCFVGAAIAAAGFVWRINHVSHPFVSPALFHNRAYVAVLLVGFFAMLPYLAAIIFVPLLLIEENGLAPAAAGLALTPSAVAIALLSTWSGGLSDRFGVRPLILVGLGIMTLALLFLSTFGAGGSALVVAACMLAFGAGFSFVQSPANNAAANALSPDEIGGGMGIFAGLFFLGSGTGPALVGAFFAARAEAGEGALNPLYALDAAPFSDAFLFMAAAVLVAMVAAGRLKSARAR